MLIHDGKKWVMPKYKITKQVVVYDDYPERYPNSTSEEVNLTSSQRSRLLEIESLPISQEDAELYVLTGEGEVIDHRTESEKMLALIPIETLQSNLTLVTSLIPQWDSDKQYYKNGYTISNDSLYLIIETPGDNGKRSPAEEPKYYKKLFSLSSN